MFWTFTSVASGVIGGVPTWVVGVAVGLFLALIRAALMTAGRSRPHS